ncbi:MAG TPA: multicopper oxidase domain-containing protein [Chloroflexota bacterium]|nr:multicopper oxidase domain-containing protein [Chloroflexota bacterium]
MRNPSRARRGWRLLLAAPLVLSLAGPAIILAQAPDASIVERTNQVEYSPAGSDQWEAAPADVTLAPGDRLRTGAGSRARVSFFDGTTTALGASAGIRVDQLDADPARIKLTQVSGVTQAQVPPDGADARYAVETRSLTVRAPGATCPWVRVAADGSILVRNYGAGPGPAVEPQPVQDVVYTPAPVPGPSGPVPVPMPQVVTVLKQMPPSTAPDEQPLLTCGPGAASAHAPAGQTDTAAVSAADLPTIRLGDVPLAAPLLGSVVAAAPADAPAPQSAPALTVTGAGGAAVQVPVGYETQMQPGQPPSAAAPIGTAAAQAAARAASLLAVQQAGAAAQQAGAAVAQGQAAAALAGATAALGNAIQAMRVGELLQTITLPTAVPAPAAPPPPPAPGVQNPCTMVVGGQCSIAGTGFFGQCTKIGSMSCSVTVSLAGAGLTGKAAVSPVVVFVTTKGAESLPCTPPIPGAPTFTCLGTVQGDVGQSTTVSVTYAPGTSLSGTATVASPNDLIEPPVRASVAGVLNTTLAARYGPVVVAGKTVLAESYESSYPGPTLRFRPGDLLRVRLDNQLPAAPFDVVPSLALSAGKQPVHDAAHDAHDTGLDFTNLHVHGMHVSPVGNGDNIFLSFNPGQSNQYEYPIPPNQPSGLYWYHPHRHGLTDQQDGFGMMGAMIVEGAIDRIPGVAGLRERLLIIHATQITPQGTVVPGDQQDPNQYIRTVNSQLSPIIHIQPGETQRWRIGNTSADSFLNIALDGNLLYQIASDGNTWDRPVGQTSIVLSPASRAEVLVQCKTPGTSIFRTLAYTQGFINTPNVPLATVVCDGPAWTPQPLPTTLLPVVDQRTLPLTGNGGQVRVVRFQELGSPPCPPNGFCPVIDGKPFDPNRVDIQVKLGTTEEWLVTNESTEEHPFHIHQNPFQVVAVNEQPVDFHGYLDTVSLPIHGSVRMRMTFEDYIGKFVIHCHILGHEDAGMMAVVEVVP